MRKSNHFKYIEIVIAIVIIFGGVYLCLSPWIPGLVNPNGASSALLKALNSKLGLMIFGLIYFVPGVALIFGLLKDKIQIRKHSLFAIYLVVGFAQLLSIVTHGLIPPTFISPSGIGVIAAILWTRIKWEERNAGTDGA